MVLLKKYWGRRQMRVNRRRSDLEIIAQMLKVSENGTGKTRIMYGANMSYSQIQKYLGYLMAQGFIDGIKLGNPSVTYKITESGLRLLNLLESIKEMLGWDEDDSL
jgi:predicted transcriptional regulator